MRYFKKFINFPRCCISLCPAGIAQYHCEITFVKVFQRHGQPVFWLERNVFGRIRRRFAVRTAVYPEDTEISGMTRPFPVVGVESKLAYRRRGSAYKPYIVVPFINKKIKVIASVK